MLQRIQDRIEEQRQGTTGWDLHACPDPAMSAAVRTVDESYAAHVECLPVLHTGSRERLVWWGTVFSRPVLKMTWSRTLCVPVCVAKPLHRRP